MGGGWVAGWRIVGAMLRYEWLFGFGNDAAERQLGKQVQFGSLGTDRPFVGENYMAAR